MLKLGRFVCGLIVLSCLAVLGAEQAQAAFARCSELCNSEMECSAACTYDDGVATTCVAAGKECKPDDGSGGSSGGGGSGGDSGGEPTYYCVDNNWATCRDTGSKVLAGQKVVTEWGWCGWYPCRKSKVMNIFAFSRFPTDNCQGGCACRFVEEKACDGSKLPGGNWFEGCFTSSGADRSSCRR